MSTSFFQVQILFFRTEILEFLFLQKQQLTFSSGQGSPPPLTDMSAKNVRFLRRLPSVFITEVQFTVLKLTLLVHIKKYTLLLFPNFLLPLFSLFSFFFIYKCWEGNTPPPPSPLLTQNYNYLGHETFKVWGPEKRIPELAYAAEIGPKIITFFEELFDYKFPLEKMDMAAIPDFSVKKSRQGRGTCLLIKYFLRKS